MYSFFSQFTYKIIKIISSTITAVYIVKNYELFVIIP